MLNKWLFLALFNDKINIAEWLKNNGSDIKNINSSSLKNIFDDICTHKFITLSKKRKECILEKNRYTLSAASLQWLKDNNFNFEIFNSDCFNSEFLGYFDNYYNPFISAIIFADTDILEWFFNSDTNIKFSKTYITYIINSKINENCYKKKLFKWFYDHGCDLENNYTCSNGKIQKIDN